MRKSLKKIHSDSGKRQYRRILSVRSKISGTSDRPRLCFSKSNKHIQIQVIDDQSSKTLFSIQTYGKNAVEGGGKSVDGAKVVGVQVAESLKKHKLTQAVFDRRGFKYTGIIAALVDSIRENGIKI